MQIKIERSLEHTFNITLLHSRIHQTHVTVKTIISTKQFSCLCCTYITSDSYGVYLQFINSWLLLIIGWTPSRFSCIERGVCASVTTPKLYQFTNLWILFAYCRCCWPIFTDVRIVAFTCVPLHSNCGLCCLVLSSC